MLLERIDELSLQHHDFGGSAERAARRLRAPDRPAQGRADRRRGLRRVGGRGLGGDPSQAASSASSPRSTGRTSGCSPRRGARDAGDLIRDALRCVREQPGVARRFEHVLIDDAQELDLAAASLAREVGGAGPDGGRRPVAGAAALPRRRRRAHAKLRRPPRARTIALARSAPLPGASRSRAARRASSASTASRRRRGRRGRVLALRQRPRAGAVGGRRTSSG